MSKISRRNLCFSASALGAIGLASRGGLSFTRAQAAQPVEVKNTNARASGDQFGAGIYNTRQVAEELRYIEENIKPVNAADRKRILITGSTGGLGQLAAAHLLKRGHSVVAHARNEQRSTDVRRDLPNLEAVVTGDLLHLEQTRQLAAEINGLGKFDAIIHNSGEYGLPDPEILNSNSLSPYLLTALVDMPRETMVYLTSSLHEGGDLKLDVIRSGGTNVNYSDSKLHMAVLATALSGLRPNLRVNAVAPGWVPTLMGFHDGPYAPDDLRAGYMTQVLLAEGLQSDSRVTGKFLFHEKEETRLNQNVYNKTSQTALLAAFSDRTGVSL